MAYICSKMSLNDIGIKTCLKNNWNVNLIVLFGLKWTQICTHCTHISQSISINNIKNTVLGIIFIILRSPQIDVSFSLTLYQWEKFDYGGEFVYRISIEKLP